jgi:hypothetical protein
LRLKVIWLISIVSLITFALGAYPDEIRQAVTNYPKAAMFLTFDALTNGTFSRGISIRAGTMIGNGELQGTRSIPLDKVYPCIGDGHWSTDIFKTPRM